MPAPPNIGQLKTFLGLVSYYYEKLVGDLHKLCAPLDELLWKSSTFAWTSKCQTAFENIKGVQKSDLLLTQFNRKYDIVVGADASDYGLRG